MRNHTAPDEPRCLCGARTDDDHALCRKCRARAAWRRKHRNVLRHRRRPEL